MANVLKASRIRSAVMSANGEFALGPWLLPRGHDYPSQCRDGIEDVRPTYRQLRMPRGVLPFLSSFYSFLYVVLHVDIDNRRV